jgi:hypothetical protein
MLIRMCFLSRRPRLLSVVHAPDPGVTPFGDSRRAPAPGELMRIPGSSLAPEIARRVEVSPDATQLASNIPPGVADTRGLASTNSGGPRLHRIQRPAAGTRNGGSQDECGGRSWRWRCPCGGIGGATAYPPAAHRFPRAQRATGRRRSVRPAPCAERHAAYPGPRDHPVMGRGRSIHPGHRGHPGCHTGRGTPCPKQGIERTATCGDRQWPFTSHPAAGGAAAPRSKPPANRRTAPR